MAANINSWHCFTHILRDWHCIYSCWHRSAIFLWWGKLALFLYALCIKGDELVTQKLQWLLQFDRNLILKYIGVKEIQGPYYWSLYRPFCMIAVTTLLTAIKFAMSWRSTAFISVDQCITVNLKFLFAIFKDCAGKVSFSLQTCIT
jgi:hypothetical protein